MNRESDAAGRYETQWFWEGNVQAAVRDQLASEGWYIVTQADPLTHAPGIDLHMKRNDESLLIEVKGYPWDRYARGPRAGRAKPTPPTTQARHWFAQALMQVVMRKQEYPDASIAMALPDFPTYRSLIRRCRRAIDALGIRIFLVTGQGLSAGQGS